MKNFTPHSKDFVFQSNINSKYLAVLYSLVLRLSLLSWGRAWYCSLSCPSCRKTSGNNSALANTWLVVRSG